ncbi:TetR/AcrR family transcriptional regulator [Rhodobacteraceae bacterium M382]|nr:TetR/AcrR family transcriptional regulator [Rhodobacteraceae bacterium M382]
MDQNKPKKRYDRKRWLETALDVLAHKGLAAVRVADLAARLNVTKGSFYHHFKSREAFLDALGEYWTQAYTDRVIETIGPPQGDGRERLLTLMHYVAERKLDRFDMAFRSWAAQDARVARVVERVDERRYHFIRSLFEDAGHTGVELEARTTAWLVFSSALHSLHFPETGSKDQPSLEDHFRVFMD